ncbi:acetyl-CoA hydrolase/transferase family protein [Adlercreutzia sp. ZJ138]|uniref:acetyl-CoA hydrolase/transferase family protein n=1 Tax=Adlercreutzia sp. ZJ138 TaxID=2709405 RepID=UPI0013ED8310|nr:acetyl-CoA hydrolase/transferase C-terminal domain-containing protein [Adlercreutzia sp. ZJ138]
MNWIKEYQARLSSPEAILDCYISNNMSIMVGGMFSAVALLQPLLRRIEDGLYYGIEMFGSSLDGPYDFANLKCSPNQFKLHSFFAGVNERSGFSNPCIQPFPMKYSNLDRIMAKIKPDLVIAMVTPPDDEGYVNLGVNGMIASALPFCTHAVAQVNSKLPRCKGGIMRHHISEFDAFVENDQELYTYPLPTITPEDEMIAGFVAERISDGACIQLGIGTIPNAIGRGLRSHEHLGVFSEMISDIMLELMETGVIDNSRKTLMPGITAGGFAMGSTREFYSTLSRRDDIEILPFSKICDIPTIASHDNFVSVNSALSVDLTGQVCAESIGSRYYSGAGGQLDFMTGAQLSKNGQSFIALKSAAHTKHGLVSRIVPTLEPGSVITTPRTCVQNIATEYGCVDLSLCSARERAERLISISHPAFREQLAHDARKCGYLS